MRDTETKMAELRLDKGLKQKDIAEILKVKTYRYSQWERGINDMPIDICNDLANFYGVSLDYLLGMSDYNNKVDNKNINLDLMRKRMFDLRKEHNLTQDQLGLEIGFPQRTYANYENGNSIPTAFKLYDIAFYYKESLDYLVGRLNNRK